MAYSWTRDYKTGWFSLKHCKQPPFLASCTVSNKTSIMFICRCGSHLPCEEYCSQYLPALWTQMLGTPISWNSGWFKDTKDFGFEERAWLQLGQNWKWLVGQCVKVTQMWTWAKYMGQPKKIYLEFSSRQEKKLKIQLSRKKLRRTTSNRQLFFCKIREEINYCVLKPWHCQNRTATQQTSTMHMLMPPAKNSKWLAALFNDPWHRLTLAPVNVGCPQMAPGRRQTLLEQPHHFCICSSVELHAEVA